MKTQCIITQLLFQEIKVKDPHAIMKMLITLEEVPKVDKKVENIKLQTP